MNSKHEIKVVLYEGDEKKAPTEASSSSSSPTTPKVNKESTSEKSFFQQYGTLEVLQSAGKGMINGTLNRIGDLTGNYQAQMNINNAMQIAQIGMAFIINPVAGAVSLASTLAFGVVDEYISRRNANIQASYLRDITGESASKESRYRGRAL